MVKWIFSSILVFLQLSCASALKKQCEGTNWFQHGHSVAMSGRRLDADDFAGRCEKEGVHANAADLDLGFKSGMQNYCKPEIVYATGKDGQFFSDDFCEPNQIRLLRQRHADGVKEFCQPDNGYEVGAKGRAYNNICPNTMEKPFMSRFKKGRRVYLGNEILNREKMIGDLENDVSDFDRDRRNKSSQRAALASQSKKQQFVTRTNPDGTHTTELQTVTDATVENQLRDLNWELSSIERKITDTREQQKKLRNEMFELRKEQSSLEE